MLKWQGYISGIQILRKEKPPDRRIMFLAHFLNDAMGRLDTNPFLFFRGLSYPRFVKTALSLNFCIWRVLNAHYIVCKRAVTLEPAISNKKKPNALVGCCNQVGSYRKCCHVQSRNLGIPHSKIYFMYTYQPTGTLQAQTVFSFFTAFNFPYEICLNLLSFELFICGHGCTIHFSTQLCTGHILADAGER